MAYTAAVITVGNRFASGEEIDICAPAVAKVLKDKGFDVIYTSAVRTDRDDISAELIKCEYELDANLIITVGGTGLSRDDVTPDATKDVLDYEIPAITQAMLFGGLQKTPYAMMTRAVTGVRNDGLIINLPGREKAAMENLLPVADMLMHAVQMISKRG